MLQNIKILLISLLFCSTALGQALPIRNDTPTALRDLGSNLSVGRNFAVDQYGQIKVTLSSGGSGASNAVKSATVSTYTAGDAVIGLGAQIATTATQQLGEVNNSYGVLKRDLNGGLYISGSVKEDSAAASGDALVAVAGEINTALNTPANPGDYGTFALGQFGQVLSTPVYDANFSTSNTPMALEDGNSMSTANGSGFKVLAQTQDPLTVDQGTNGDAAWFKVDRAGRTITTLAPAGESWQACSGTVTNTSDSAIKAAVASNRIYVTNLDCYNNSAVASVLTVKTAATAIYSLYIGSTSAGDNTINLNFPVPLRTNSNEALNFAMVTTSTSTVCCAGGYISVN